MKQKGNIFYEILDATTGYPISVKKITQFPDGTPITTEDTRDNDVLFELKSNGEFAARTFDVGQSKTLVVDNVEAIRNLSKSDALMFRLGVYTNIRTEGYYEPNDGGGFEYLYNSVSTQSDDGFLSIKPILLGEGRFIPNIKGEINIKITGALGDGESDDSTKIQSAFDAPMVRVIKLNDSPYKLNNNISLSRANVQVDGGGADFIVDSALTGAIISISGSDLSHIHDFSINGSSGKSNAIVVDNCNGTMLSNLAFGSIGYSSITVNNSSGISVSRINVIGSQIFGEQAGVGCLRSNETSQDISFNRINIKDCFGKAIALNSNNTTLDGFTIENILNIPGTNIGGMGIYVGFETIGVSVLNGEVNGAQTHLCKLSGGSTSIKIDNVKFFNNDSFIEAGINSLIEVSGVSFSSISNCIFQHTGTVADSLIRVTFHTAPNYASHDIDITNCIFKNNGFEAVNRAVNVIGTSIMPCYNINLVSCPIIYGSVFMAGVGDYDNKILDCHITSSSTIAVSMNNSLNNKILGGSITNLRERAEQDYCIRSDNSQNLIIKNVVLNGKSTGIRAIDPNIEISSCTFNFPLNVESLSTVRNIQMAAPSGGVFVNNIMREGGRNIGETLLMSYNNYYKDGTTRIVPNATDIIKGVVNRSGAVASVISVNATDLATTMALANELKVQFNAKLAADRASGQQAT